MELTWGANDCDAGTISEADDNTLCIRANNQAGAAIKIYQDGTFITGGSAIQTGDPDIAEQLPVNDASIESGDILVATNPVGLHNSRIYDNVLTAKSSEPYQASLIGAVSTSPSILIGEANAMSFDKNNTVVNGDRRAIALAGRIPVKVSTINGAIAAGDSITSSTISGHGMKATQAGGAIVGKALQPFAGANDEYAELIPCPAGTPSYVRCAKIIVMVSTSTTPGLVTENGGSSLAVSALAEAMTISDYTITTDLNMVINGSLTANAGLTVTGNAEFKGPAMFRAIAEFIDRVIFNKDVEFRGRAIFNKDSGGFAEVAAGQSEVTISFEQEYGELPVISASPSIDQLDQDTYDAQVLADTCEAIDTIEECQEKVETELLDDMPTYVVTKKTTTGFTVKLAQPATKKIKFSWSAIAIQDAQTAQN